MTRICAVGVGGNNAIFFIGFNTFVFYRQMVRTRTPSGSSEINIPQVEVILTHSLVCRKTRREFVVGPDPDASFVANLAKHIRQMQPGPQVARANSLLCIFCNSPYKDLLRPSSVASRAY